MELAANTGRFAKLSSQNGQQAAQKIAKIDFFWPLAKTSSEWVNTANVILEIMTIIEII